MLNNFIAISILLATPSLSFATPATPEPCIREVCSMRIEVDRKTQLVQVYKDSKLVRTLRASTGKRGYDTPRFDDHPKAVFSSHRSAYSPVREPMIQLVGGIFIIGALNKNSLDKPSTHGAIRIGRPDIAQLYREVVEVGVENTWITVR